MKTAEDWLDILRLTEPQDMSAWITLVQAEAYKTGLLVAAEIADNYVNAFATNSEAQNICGSIRDEIVSHSNLDITENPPF